MAKIIFKKSKWKELLFQIARHYNATIIKHSDICTRTHKYTVE